MTERRSAWLPPPPQPALGHGEAHVWRAMLDMSEVERRRLEGSLSPDEHRRSIRFRRPVDRQRFVAAHGVLRAILSRYLQVGPSQLAFRYGVHGKPALAGAGLNFNLSHSGPLALYAVSGQGPVGVDVERMEAGIECEELSARFFSLREHAALRLLPPETRREAFFACWTRKEAFLKACGGGLSLPLDDFDVSMEQPARLLGVRGALRVGGPWWMQDCAAGPGYAAAVVGEGPPVRVVRWQWAG